MSDATDVLQAVDQLRRDLSGYHGQLKAHNDLQRHCDHQRERIAELEAIHARDKAENAKLRELMVRMAEALGIDSEWADPNWCKSNCVLGFGCWPEEERTDIRCPAWAAMQELGIEVDDA